MMIPTNCRSYGNEVDLNHRKRSRCFQASGSDGGRRSERNATPVANGGAPKVTVPFVEIISMRNNAWRVNVICEKGPGTLHRLIEGIEQAALLLIHVDVLVNEHLLELRSVALLQVEDDDATALDSAALRESLLRIINEELDG
ncbi:hypothetical protein KP509_01G118100 [Ceratopteris richardii]|uniref:ACT domain-containing protein n=1 Tax=Ceratopteris richardii TaxID=49495 RepID=A0A8T2VKC7_CERRI|nr:hypothetical protein KP509_01G118100 [Ceratopteris richardii]